MGKNNFIHTDYQPGDNECLVDNGFKFIDLNADDYREISSTSVYKQLYDFINLLSTH